MAQAAANVVASYSIQLSSAEFASCAWNGEKDDWPLVWQNQLGFIDERHQFLADMIGNVITRASATTSGDLTAYIGWNKCLYRFLVRTVKLDTEHGKSLRQQIVQMESDAVLASGDGLELLNFLHRRASLRSDGDSAEALQKLNAMQLRTDMQPAQVEQFATHMRRTYSRCSAVGRASVGDLSMLLVSKMPSECASERRTLHTQLQSAAAFGTAAPSFEQLTDLIAGLLTTWRLEHKSVAHHVGGTEDVLGTLMQKIQSLEVALTASRRPQQGQLTCNNCNGKHLTKDCTAKPCGKCGFRFCGALTGNPCMITSTDPLPAVGQHMPGGKIMSFNYRRLLQRSREKRSAPPPQSAHFGRVQSSSASLTVPPDCEWPGLNTFANCVVHDPLGASAYDYGSDLTGFEVDAFHLQHELAHQQQERLPAMAAVSLPVALSSQHVNDSWVSAVVDSGATDTVFADERLLLGTPLRASSVKFIGVGNPDHPVRVEGVARPVLSFGARGADGVSNVAVHGISAPAMARTLLSVVQMFELHRIHTYFNGVMQLRFPGGECVPILREPSGLPVVRIMLPASAQAQVLLTKTSRANDLALLWHSRMCLTPETLSSLQRTTIGHNLDPVTEAMRATVDNCTVRQSASMRKLPVPVLNGELSLHSTLVPGERLLVDGWGPFPTACVATAHNFVFFGADQATGFPFAASTLRHTASEWLAFVRSCKLQLATYNRTLKVLRADGAGELRSDAFQRGCAELGIQCERSAPYEHNGVAGAERLIGLASERMRAYLHRSSLSDGFAILAILYAVEVLKHIAKRGESSTRFTHLTQRRDDVSRLRVFGCPMAGLVDVSVRGDKAEPRTRQGVFVGLKDGHWLLYSEGKLWPVRNQASFYEEGLMRVGLLPKQVTLDSMTQTGDVDLQDIGAQPVAPKVTPSDAAKDTSDEGGRRPDGGKFHLRGRVLHAEVAYHAGRLDAIVSAATAAEAEQIFGPELFDGDALALEQCSLPRVPGAPPAKGKTIQLMGPQGPYSILQPSSQRSAAACEDALRWRNAEDEHIAKITAFGRIDVVPRAEAVAANAEIYRGHWVYAVKVLKDTGWLDKLKARYVLDGQEWAEESETYAGVIPEEFVRVLLADAAVSDKVTLKFDIGDFFQEGEWPDAKPRYMEMPQGHVEFDEQGVPMLYRLNKPFWGAPPAGRSGDKRLRDVLLQLGCEENTVVPRLYKLRRAGDTVLVGTHVDDGLLTCGNKVSAEYVLSGLQKAFHKVTFEFEPTTFKGFSIARSRPQRAITIRMTQRIVDVVAHQLPSLLSQPYPPPPPVAKDVVGMMAELSAFRRPDPLPRLSKPQKLAQRWIGELKYVDQAVPQLKLYVHALTRHMAFPPVPVSLRMCAAVSTMMLREADVGITFGGPPLRSAQPLELSVALARPPALDASAPVQLEASYDATWQSPPVKSVQSSVITYAGGAIAVDLSCVPTIMPASFNAELHSAVVAVTKVAWISEGMQEMGILPCGAVNVWGDNKSVLDMSISGAVPTRSRADARRIGILQQYQRDAIVTIGKVHTDDNPADFIGKLVSRKKYERSVRFITNSSNAVPAATKVQDMLASAAAIFLSSA